MLSLLLKEFEVLDCPMLCDKLFNIWSEISNREGPSTVTVYITSYSIDITFSKEK